MKNFKYLLAVCTSLILLVGCKKDLFEDVAFLDGASASAKLSALYNITQDNTGLVTITPMGEGATSFDVYFGDATTAPVTLLPGKSTQHVYKEGLYKVKMVARNILGKTTEATQDLTVSFRAPENLEVTAVIDPANKYKVNVSAKALYETFFQVYFGDVANEVPTNFLEGQTISKTYARTGSYTVRVVALSGGAATTTFTKVITIVDPVVLPVTFESTSINYAWNDFSGGNVTVVANPHSNAANASTRVAKMVKNAGDPWGGSWIGLAAPIDFSTKKTFKVKVFSPRVGAKLLLKVENQNDGGISFEKEVTTTVAGAWETLTFDYSAINTARTYQKIVLIFDLGTVGDGSANFTFLFDDITLN